MVLSQTSSHKSTVAILVHITMVVVQHDEYHTTCHFWQVAPPPNAIHSSAQDHTTACNAGGFSTVPWIFYWLTQLEK